MKILVLAHALTSAGGLNVGKSILEGLANVASENSYYVVIPSGLGYEQICARFPESRIKIVNRMHPLQRIIFDKFTVPRLVTEHAIDVVLALDTSMANPNLGVPQAAFLHAAHLVYPPAHYGKTSVRDRLRHWYLQRHFRGVLTKIELVFCQTNSMRDRLLAKYNFEGKMPVVRTATPSFFTGSSPIAPSEFSELKTGIKLFYPTRYYPHKNIERIVDMYVKYRTELEGVTTFLTIEEDHHKNVPKILKRIDSEGLSGSIINLGHIDYSIIHKYFEHADALFIPSLLESFSTAYVEATHFNLPILTSDLDFARDSCGGHTTYFDPFNIEEIRDGILKFISNGIGPKAPKSKNTPATRNWNEISGQIAREMEIIAHAK